MEVESIEKKWNEVWKNKEGYTEFEKLWYSFLWERSVEFEGKRVLEIGCGTGRGLVPFLSKRALCVGGDIS